MGPPKGGKLLQVYGPVELGKKFPRPLLEGVRQLAPLKKVPSPRVDAV